jgi:glucose-6-phosphate 1-epimerase
MGSGASAAAEKLSAATLEETKGALKELSPEQVDKLRSALQRAMKSGQAKGQGNLDTVVLRHASGASAEIYLLGATLCSYKTSDGKEQIFVSPGAIWDGKKAIRGGVPLVFPQFGQPDKAMPQHGFARSSIWAVKEVKDAPEESIAIFTLNDSDATREKWPHAFGLEYVVSLTAAALKMTLRVTNTGDSDFQFHALLHTYFNIPDVGDAVVNGLKGRNYIDKVAGGEIKSQTEDDILLPSFTDRVYTSTTAEPKDVVVAQKGGAARFEIRNEARIADSLQPCDVVVWNPYEEASPGDLPPPAYKSFVCVEPGLVGEFAQLAPKTYAELSQKIVAKSGLAKGQGGLDTVVLRHESGASAEIYLLGATLCSYKTSDGKEQIFVSPGAIWDGKKAIRGGVPLVFPQFGQPDKAMPQHGFARSSIWAVKEVKDTAEESRAIFTLSDSDATRGQWPHAFALEFEVLLRAGDLKMTMRITNTGDSSFTFHALLHTYFKIPDVGDAVVQGLKDHNYIDKVAGGENKLETEESIILPSFTDRVYTGTKAEPKDVTVARKGGAASFKITNESRIADAVQPCDVVVWNPYEEASPGDLPPPAFRNFVCVEPGLVSKFHDLAHVAQSWTLIRGPFEGNGSVC